MNFPAEQSLGFYCVAYDKIMEQSATRAGIIMKNWNWASFIIGFVVGAGLIIGIGFVSSIFMFASQSSHTNVTENITMLQEGEVGAEIATESIVIRRVLDSNIGIAEIAQGKKLSTGYFYGQPEVLYIAPENQMLFEGQEIAIPEGKKLMQVGTYKTSVKTIAAVQIK